MLALHVLSSRVTTRIWFRIRFGVWLVSGYAHVFVLLFVVVVTNYIVTAILWRVCKSVWRL